MEFKKYWKDNWITFLISFATLILISIQTYFSAKMGGFQMTHIRIEIFLVLLFIIYFVVHHIIIRKILTNKLTKSLSEEIEKNNDQKIKEKAEKLAIEMITPDKKITNLKNKLWDILKISQSLFNAGYSYSFLKIIEKCNIDKEKEKIIILNQCFSFFQKRFNDSNDIPLLCLEFVCITNFIEQIFNNFHNQMKTKEWDDDLINSYDQMKNEYNNIVTQLNNYFKITSGELNIKLAWNIKCFKNRN